MPEPTPWYCTVCGADSPDFVPARTVKHHANTLGRTHGVIALPCGHEQPDGLACRTEEEQRAHRIATSPSPTGTRAYLAALSNPDDRRHRRAPLSGSREAER